MKLIAAVFLAASAHAATIDAASDLPTSLGIFQAGEQIQIQISVSGVVDLATAGTQPDTNLLFNPDGSLHDPPPLSCNACWIGYQYMLQGAAYPTVAGGDGINHFPGGGGNFDLNAGAHSPWALEGAHDTDTLDPLDIRFGALAISWDLVNWIDIGYGGTLQAPADVALWGIVVDAEGARYNDTGGYQVTITAVPEPATLLLVGASLLLGGSAATSEKTVV